MNREFFAWVDQKPQKIWRVKIERAWLSNGQFIEGPDISEESLKTKPFYGSTLCRYHTLYQDEPEYYAVVNFHAESLVEAMNGSLSAFGGKGSRIANQDPLSILDKSEFTFDRFWLHIFSKRLPIAEQEGCDPVKLENYYRKLGIIK